MLIYGGAHLIDMCALDRIYHDESTPYEIARPTRCQGHPTRWARSHEAGEGASQETACSATAVTTAASTRRGENRH